MTREFCLFQAFAGERACYQSLVTYNGQLVLLGTKGIHVMTLRTWREVSVLHDFPMLMLEGMSAFSEIGCFDEAGEIQASAGASTVILRWFC